MALDHDAARERLVQVRKTFDEAAKDILETLKSTDSRVEEEVIRQTEQESKKIEESIGGAFDEFVRRFEDWDFKGVNAVPLNEDQDFMRALHEVVDGMRSLRAT